MPMLFADCVYDWRIIPHAAVSKRALIYDFALLQQIYLQPPAQTL